MNRIRKLTENNYPFECFGINFLVDFTYYDVDKDGSPESGDPELEIIHVELDERCDNECIEEFIVAAIMGPDFEFFTNRIANEFFK